MIFGFWYKKWSMDFKELKELAKKLGGIVVMNGSTPELVILSYESYKKLENTTVPAGHPAGGENTEEVEKLNQEILGLKEEIRQKEETELLGVTGTEVEEG